MRRVILLLLIMFLSGCGGTDADPGTEFAYTRTVSDPLTFYFDFDNGSNSQDGLSELTPLKDLWTLDYIPLVPGDVIALKRGSVWPSDRIRITGSGTALLPIAVTAWGTGADPSLANTSPEEPAVFIGGSHVTVSNLTVAGTVRAPGIQTGPSSSYVVISDCEINDAGIGVTFRGDHHTLEDSYVHDLHLIRNTVGGDDDYGANGVFISEAEHILVRRNTFRNCLGASHDYGTDGGTVELWKSCSDITIEYNRSEANNGFMEIGGVTGDTVSDVLVHHNVSLNDIAVFVPHFSGTFAASVSGISFENNTIVVSVSNQGYSLFYAPDTVLQAGTLSVRNNIICTNTAGAGRIYALGSGSVFVHTDNLYNLPETQIGYGSYTFTPDGTELVNTDPLFTDAAGRDFSPGAGSPAANNGADLGYTADIDGNGIPYATTVPDIGAYESEIP